MPFIPTPPPPLASPLSLLFYLTSLSPVLVVADVVGYSLWLKANLLDTMKRHIFPRLLGVFGDFLMRHTGLCIGSFLKDSGTCYSSRVWQCAGVSVWIRTLKFIMCRREGGDWEWTRKCMHRVSCMRIVVTAMNRILSLSRIANQLNDDACTAQAILNILLNCSNVDIGTELSEFKEYMREMSPKTLQMKGLAISDSFLSHGTFLQIAYIPRKPPPEEGNEETYHFISYVPAYGKLWELDGLKSGPLEMGDMMAMTEWIDVVWPALRTKMRKYGSGGDGGGHDIWFSLPALAGNIIYARQSIDRPADKSRLSIDWPPQYSAELCHSCWGVLWLVTALPRTHWSTAMPLLPVMAGVHPSTQYGHDFSIFGIRSK
ncbi:cysteine proteinase [Armillaria gallica]|uniref:ubiquitinyl hydrolase 1 n=1 Tax=Armillaria gallica TaxID=47427 RepID=A0A2H3DSY0_ARMGA|nr:cysteine proteinase [Armillaria gallica]